MLKKISFVLLLTFLLIGCSAKPSQEYVLGDTLLSENFTAPEAWETFVGETVDLQVVDGAYRVRTEDEGYIWGLNEQDHSDVVIEVEASQLSTHENNAYGVMCRADTSNNGDGYYFLVSGDGYYSIGKGSGDDVLPLVEWTQNSAVNKGQASNTIRAVCIGNYLAMYVNDTFLAEVNDSDFGNGYAGLAATAFEGGDTDISFDNLTITAASLP
ncbi:MAG: hypothetical protein R3E31_16470 [Chloroflexota bacterium]